MKSATIAKLRNNLSRYLQEVRRGETIEILDRDLPIARLVRIEPPGPGSLRKDQEAWLTRMERQGVIKRGSLKAVPEILAGRPKAGPLPPSAVAALLNERRRGR